MKKVVSLLRAGAKVRESGFALPTILISSVVMTIVLLTSIQSLAGSGASLETEFYRRESQDAALAATIKAQTCMAANSGNVTWSDANPLRPSTNCAGVLSATCSSTPNDASCFFVATTSYRTTFSVGAVQTLTGGAKQINATASVQRLRKSTGLPITTGSTYTTDKKIVVAPPGVRIGNLDLGLNTNCGIIRGVAHCNGFNTKYALGTGDLNTATVLNPKGVIGAVLGKNLVDVSTDVAHSCAIDELGKAYCWGTNTGGAVTGDNASIGSTYSSSVAVYSAGVLSASTLTTIVTGGLADGTSAHTCALDTTGKAYCWGTGAVGQVGTGTPATVSGPATNAATAVAGGLFFSDIDAGGELTCAISNSGARKPYCWGSDQYGQVCDGTPLLGNNQNKNAPSLCKNGATSSTAVYNAYDFDDVSVGQAHACAHTVTGEVLCWGNDSSGEAQPDGTSHTATTHRRFAVLVAPIAGEGGWSKVSAGDRYTCGLTSTGKAYCWGRDGPQIGDGDTLTTNRITPAAVDMTGVLAGKTLTDIWAGYNTTIARDSDGVYYAWGARAYGLAGDGQNTASSAVPIVASVYSTIL